MSDNYKTSDAYNVDLCYFVLFFFLFFFCYPWGVYHSSG